MEDKAVPLPVAFGRAGGAFLTALGLFAGYVAYISNDFELAVGSGLILIAAIAHFYSAYRVLRREAKEEEQLEAPQE